MEKFSSATPSYSIESSDEEEDQEEELDQEESKGQTIAKKLAKKVIIEIQLEDKLLVEGTEAIFFIGEAGERLNIDVKDSGIEVLVDNEQVGAIHLGSTSTPTLVFLSITIPLASLHSLVTHLLTTLKPKSGTIIASYHFPSYVTSSSSSTNPDKPIILYLRSQSSTVLEKLNKASLIQPFSPPNLLHGLPASLLSLSTLSSIPTVLFLFPTVSPNEPLNGPWSNNSISTKNTASLYNVSDEGGMMASIQQELVTIAKELKWTWLSSGSGTGDKGFSWLEKIRKVKRREQMGSMYM